MAARDIAVVATGEKAEVAQVRESGSCVLLIDDDQGLRTLLECLVRRLGYEVLAAASGSDALAVYRKRGGEIDAVLLDLYMPDMDGWTTLEQLRQIDSTIRVILMSGCDECEAKTQMPGDTRLGFLHKPFTLSAIRKTLQETMRA